VSTGIETIFSKTISDSSERANLSQVFVDAARFYDDESGYFFIETINDAWVVAHINHDLIGTSRIDIQDDYGKYFIQDIVETVKYSGYGFVEYYRLNPSSQEYERKLSFVTSIPSAQWFIGTGFYGGPSDIYYSDQEFQKNILLEVTQTMANGISGVFEHFYEEENDRITFCQDFIDHMRFFDDGSGYFFISDMDGVTIAHGANADLQGNNEYDLQDLSGQYIIRDMIDIVNSSGSGYYEYSWNNPVTGNISRKITYVTRIPNSDYFIGSGYYLDN
jgi:signal transduction histidine kinase